MAKKILGKDLEGYLEMKYGGSVSKHTYVNGLSDVDILVTINESSLKNVDPKGVIKYFAETLRARLPRTVISEGKLAVTVKYADGHEIQLLPCISSDKGIKISSSNGTEWSKIIKPFKFAEKLTEVNRRNSGRVVPVIKLFKAINNSLNKQLRLTGYHIESLAIEAFKSYKGNVTYHDMLKHLVSSASEKVLKPITDKTGQSIHVDDYLESSGSLKRMQYSKNLQRIHNKMKRAEATQSLVQWEILFDDK